MKCDPKNVTGFFFKFKTGKVCACQPSFNFNPFYFVLLNLYFPYRDIYYAK